MQAYLLTALECLNGDFKRKLPQSHRMERIIAYLVIGVLLTYQISCQICNLGMSYRNTTTASSKYGQRTPDKAFDGLYSIDREQCFSSSISKGINFAWWEVTFQSISKIFKINLVFRDTGCVEGEVIESCACANTTIGGQGPDLWQTSVVFGTGSLALTCNDNYLSIMNMSDFDDSEFLSILETCDGKQHCSFNSNSHIQHKTIMFYCQDKCSNVNYKNSLLNRTVVEDLGIEYQPDVSDPFTAFLKSRVYDCNERHILTSGNLTRQCQEQERWSGEDPVCNVTCQQPDHDNSTTIRQSRSPIYFEDYSVSYTCREHHRHVHGNLTRVCNGSGDWSGEIPVCKRCKCPCDRVKTQYFITDAEVLQKKINKLSNELKVNRKDLSAAVRAKTCAEDKRESSKYLGFITGIVITTTVLGIIVCSDLPLMYRQILFGPYASRTR